MVALHSPDAAIGEPPRRNFGVERPLTVEKATLLVDGGSAILRIRDSRGATLGVSMRAWTSSYKGHVKVQLPGVAEWLIVPLASEPERDLLALLRSASLHTFGTIDRGAARAEGIVRNFELDATAVVIQRLSKRNPPNVRKQ